MMTVWVLAAATAQAADQPPPTFSPESAALGDRITVTVSPMTNQDVTVKASDKSKVVLFLDGVPFKGLCAESYYSTNETSRFTFILQRTDSTWTNWVCLLGSPKKPSKLVEVGIGWDGDRVAQTSDGKLNLVVIRDWSLWIFSGLFVLFAYGFLVLATRTEILRDSGPSPAKNRPPHTMTRWQAGGWCAVAVGATLTVWQHRGEWLFLSVVLVVGFWELSGKGLQRPPPNCLKPFSLARLQMAVWFFLVVIAFVFLWLVTRSIDTLNSTVLVLMGIGAGTALGAEVQNAGKPTKLDDLNNERQTLAVKPVANRTPEEVTQLVTLDQQINAEINKPPPASVGFLDDILTDASGISFHRFQMAVWTFVLGIIFVVGVYRDLAMPDFNGTLLALLGISNGTYLGFMIPEGNISKQS
jgi:hypothetical protein